VLRAYEMIVQAARIHRKELLRKIVYEFGVCGTIYVFGKFGVMREIISKVTDTLPVEF